jgi:VWFA-related protein
MATSNRGKTSSLWRTTATAAGVALACGLLWAQQEPKFSVQVKVVNVPATVRDKHGRVIHDLTKDDFILEEDSRPQSIHYFSQESDLPLTLGLLVDTSFSQLRVLDQERTASFSFLDDMLRPDKDLAFLIHFDFDVELLEDLTDSRQKLRSAMDMVQPPQMDRQRGGSSPGTGAGYPRRRGGMGGPRGGGGGTLLYDAVYLAANDMMKKQTGRKAIVILSDGVDHGSKESLKDAIEAAQRADTIVYAIFFKGDEPSMGFGGWGGHHGGRGRYPEEEVDGKKVLEQISKETGGRTFEVSGKETVGKIYSQIEDELRNQYSLGYTPDRSDPGAGYHKISLKTKQKDLVVQARAGYYANAR